METYIIKDGVGIIGLGYVGLPLAFALSKNRNVIGFDINPTRIKELQDHIDRTQEIKKKEFSNLSNLHFTGQIQDLNRVKFLIVTVPTPIDSKKNPDLRPLKSACKIVGLILKKNVTVIFESTVYPGTTEEICVPILEKVSGLKLNSDFYVGYSPERVNPGDKMHQLKDIVKVVSGSNAETLDRVATLYEEIIQAGVYRASSIKVAEAAKVIENTQRDLNIALVNELSMIFDRLGIDTMEVLDAANTKWNFQKFTPGLVGGHCIDVDPYYLTFKAQSVGYKPEVILSGRKINDNMFKYVVKKFVIELKRQKKKIEGSSCLILGLTFKENCPDLRNTGAVKLIRELENYGIKPTVVDPWAEPEEAMRIYGLELCPIKELVGREFDNAILAVAHQEFLDFPSNLRKIVGTGLIFDIKSVLPREIVDLRL